MITNGNDALQTDNFMTDQRLEVVLEWDSCSCCESCYGRMTHATPSSTFTLTAFIGYFMFYFSYVSVYALMLCNIIASDSCDK